MLCCFLSSMFTMPSYQLPLLVVVWSRICQGETHSCIYSTITVDFLDSYDLSWNFYKLCRPNWKRGTCCMCLASHECQVPSWCSRFVITRGQCKPEASWEASKGLPVGVGIWPQKHSVHFLHSRLHSVPTNPNPMVTHDHNWSHSVTWPFCQVRVQIWSTYQPINPVLWWCILRLEHVMLSTQATKPVGNKSSGLQLSV